MMKLKSFFITLFFLSFVFSALADNSISVIDSMLLKAEATRWNEPKLALQIAEEALKLSNEESLSEQIIKSKLQIADCYYTLSEYKKSEEIAQSLVLEAKKLDNDEILAKVYLILGTINDEKQEYITAVNFYFKAEKLYLNLSGLKSKKYLAEVYFNLGVTFLFQRFDAEALEYFDKALEIGYLSKTNEMITYNWLGKYYNLVKNFKESDNYFAKAIEMAEANQSTILLAYSYLNRSQFYINSNQIDLAILDIMLADSINETVFTWNNLALVELQKAKITGLQKDFNQSSRHIDSLWYYIQKYDLNDLKVEAFKLNIDLSLNQEDYSSAAEKYTNYLNYKDSIFSDFNTSKIAKLNTANNLSQIKIEKEQQEKQILIQKDKQKNYLFLSAIALISAIILAYSYLRIRNKNEKLESLNEQIETQKNILEANSNDLNSLNSQLEIANSSLKIANSDLENFAFIAAHDIKAPVRTVSQFANILKAEGESLSDTNKELLNFIVKGTNQINNIVDGVLSYSSIQKKSQEHTFFSLRTAINESVLLLKSEIEKTHTKIEIQEGDMKMMGSVNLIIQMLVNLIDNGIKYSKKDLSPEIKIHFEEDNYIQKIIIEDNGIGISDKNFNKLFLMFKRLNSSSEYEGSGIGLSSCLKIANLHKGTIDVESKEGEGSKFIVLLPKKV